MAHGRNWHTFPFAALHKSGSYWGFYCRAFAIARRVRFDSEPALDGGVNGKEFVGSSDYYEQTRAARSYDPVALTSSGALTRSMLQECRKGQQQVPPPAWSRSKQGLYWSPRSIALLIPCAQRPHRQSPP
jgi:hypothetical protein